MCSRSRRLRVCVIFFPAAPVVVSLFSLYNKLIFHDVLLLQLLLLLLSCVCDFGPTCKTTKLLERTGLTDRRQIYLEKKDAKK